MDVNRLYETVVYLYLTAGKGLFVNPQYPMKVGEKEFLPDFVALDPAEKRVWLVEVTWAKSGDKIATKCRDYAKHKDVIRDLLGAACPPDWSLGVWLFLTSATAAAVSSKLIGLGDMVPRVETLEHAGAVWKWSQAKASANGSAGISELAQQFEASELGDKLLG